MEKGTCHVRMCTIHVNLHVLQYVHDCQCMEEACEGWARELLCRAVFRAWVRDTATARREGWERERRAKMHYVRSVSGYVCRYRNRISRLAVLFCADYKSSGTNNTCTKYIHCVCVQVYVYMNVKSCGLPHRMPPSPSSIPKCLGNETSFFSKLSKKHTIVSSTNIISYTWWCKQA